MGCVGGDGLWCGLGEIEKPQAKIRVALGNKVRYGPSADVAMPGGGLRRGSENGQTVRN